MNARNPSRRSEPLDRQQLLDRLENAWVELETSFQGLSEEAWGHPGIVGDWSAKDILGHVTTWEEACLRELPALMKGPKSLGYKGGLQGGLPARATSEVNRFNAETVAGKRGLPLVQILKEFAQSHRRVVEFIQGTAEVHFARETPFRQRLRWDTYSHYREHARAIRAWRDARGV